MRIGFVIENSSSSGGSYYQTVNFLNDIKKNFKKKHSISIYTNQKENLKISNNRNHLFSFNFLDKIILKLSTFYFFRLYLKLTGLKTSFEKLLLNVKNKIINYII